MANVELSQSEYQVLLDAQSELKSVKKEVDSLTTEMENKNKALEVERERRKKAETKTEELTTALTEKDSEIEKTKSEFADFETLKEKATKFDEFQETKTNEIKTKLETLNTEIWKEVLEKHSKFLESMSDDLKVEYLESIKGTEKKEGFENKTPAWEAPKQNTRLDELMNKKSSNSLAPSEKIELLTLQAKKESNV